MTGADTEWYVFGICGAGLPPALRLHGRSLRTLPIGAATVVVERHRGRVEPTRESLGEQHAIVADLAERAESLLPARFGSVLRRAALEAAVLEHQAEIVRALALVAGRRQMTVRVFGPPGRAVHAHTAAASGTAYLEARRARARHVPAEVETIQRVLGGLAAAERVDSSHERPLRATVFHLIDRALVDPYRSRAADLQPLLAPWPVMVTGPWPAFAFSPELF
jgi:hypothetical protein